jgi:hypothetical protein
MTHDAVQYRHLLRFPFDSLRQPPRAGSADQFFQTGGIEQPKGKILECPCGEY